MQLRIVLIGALCFSANLAYAEETKKIDFTTPIVVDGKTIIDDFKCPTKPDGKRDCETPMTVGELSYFALQKPQPNQSWTDGIKRNDLAHSIREAKDFPLLEEQRATIENAIGPLAGSNAILGAVRDVIDPKAK